MFKFLYKLIYLFFYMIVKSLRLLKTFKIFKNSNVLKDFLMIFNYLKKWFYKRNKSNYNLFSFLKYKYFILLYYFVSIYLFYLSINFFIEELKLYNSPKWFRKFVRVWILPYTDLLFQTIFIYYIYILFLIVFIGLLYIFIKKLKNKRVNYEKPEFFPGYMFFLLGLFSDIFVISWFFSVIPLYYCYIRDITKGQMSFSFILILVYFVGRLYLDPYWWEDEYCEEYWDISRFDHIKGDLVAQMSEFFIGDRPMEYAPLAIRMRRPEYSVEDTTEYEASEAIAAEELKQNAGSYEFNVHPYEGEETFMIKAKSRQWEVPVPHNHRTDEQLDEDTFSVFLQYYSELKNFQFDEERLEIYYEAWTSEVNELINIEYSLNFYRRIDIDSYSAMKEREERKRMNRYIEDLVRKFNKRNKHQQIDLEKLK